MDNSTGRFLGAPVSMAVGVLSLVIAMGVGFLIWNSQVTSMGDRAGTNKGPQAIIDQTRVTGTVTQMRAIASRLQNYRLQADGFPDSLDTLGQVRSVDSWGAEMVYEPEGRKVERDGEQTFPHYSLTSRGQDGLLDSDDDIVMEDGIVRMADLDDESAVAKEQEGIGGMVDPGPSGSNLPAARRALSNARRIAGEANKRQQ